MNRYLGKSYPTVKTISEHTQDLLDHLSTMKRLYPTALEQEEWEMLWLACCYHDLGKMNALFQNKLYRRLGLPLLPTRKCSDSASEVPHGYLSAAFMDPQELGKKYGEKVGALISAVFYHHARAKLETRQDWELYQEVLDNDLPAQCKEFPFEHIGRPGSLTASFARYIEREDADENVFACYVRLKGLLNRLDYAASAEIDAVEQELDDADAQSLSQRVDAYLPQLRPLQQYMKDHQEENLIIVASTGMGKTEGALLWIGRHKGFYTLPLKVSINAIYGRIRGESKIKFRPVALLHSGAYEFYLNKEDDMDLAEEQYQQARLFSHPLTVCTVDQLFRFVFQYEGFESILATLMYSKVVIDEIQMYSPDIVACILHGLRMIQQYGGKFAIVTATIPKLLLHLMDDMGIRYTRPHPFLTSKIRHRLCLVDDSIDCGVIAEMAKQKKVLVIVNTIKAAQRLYSQLEVDNKWLLHSGFIRCHRQVLEDQIVDFSTLEERKHETGVWISTQIVEASLDIDFDVLFTEMCAIDSLFQRMGRVYRQRQLEHSLPNIYVYLKASGVGHVIDQEIYSFSCNVLLSYHEKALREEDKLEMMDMVYDPIRNTALSRSKYYKVLRRKLKFLKSLIPFSVERDYVHNNFRNIDSVTVIPESIWACLVESGKVANWENMMKTEDRYGKHRAQSDFMQYTISLSWYRDLPIEFGNNLIYSNSRIYLCKCPYYFDTSTSRGIGLERISRSRYYQTDSSNII